ncbi:TIGR04255 family protein [Patescibacteria group bacterium]|nr:TIGR04255 family protein [Patescibacteria group bacterium]MBU4580004.1 TIGR04255 family protein [Patescibacteria group bacterium]
MSKQYKNSPITEAVCEFRFELAESPSPQAVDLIFKDIRNYFPKKKKGQTYQMEFSVDRKENKEEFKKNFGEFDQFFSEDEKTFIQLDKGRLSIHKLKPYETWDKFNELINLAFVSYKKNIKIKFIQRIGLRYINNFEIPDKTFDIKDYFNLKPDIGNGLSQDLASFFVAIIFVFEKGRDNMRVQLLNKPVSAGENPFFALDMDYFLAQPNALQSDNTSNWLTLAHKNIENTFETALTEKAKKLFD